MTFILALSALFSRIIGILRNYLLASAFGAGTASDAYFAAFQIPDTLYRFLVAGAISASFVPFFLSARRENYDKAWQFTSSVLNILLILIGAISVIIFIFATPITTFLYPKFDSASIIESTKLLRIMILSPLLFTVSAILSGIQNAFRSFIGFALAPILYNLGIIGGIVFLTPSFGISGVAIGVMIGCALHVLVQWFPVKTLGFQWKLIISVTPELKKFFWSTVPRLLSMAGFQIMFFVEGVIATMLATGDLSVLRYAEDIQYFPVGIVGLSMAISSFSVLSDMAIDQKHQELSSYLRDKLDHIMMILIPASFGVYLLRVPLITLVLRGGNFTTSDVLLTASVLAALCLDIVATSLIPMLARTFFAFHDTVRPFVVIVTTVLLNAILAFILASQFGVMGIGLAGAIAATVAVIFFILLLRAKYFKDFSFFSFRHTGYFLLASIIMTEILSLILESITFSTQWIWLFVQVISISLIGAFIYGIFLYGFFGKKAISMVKEIGK